MLSGESSTFLFAQATATSNSAIITFALYILGVLFIAWLSGKWLKGRNFLNEYFLGSRSLGTWAFALTFAATSASGGSFIGFPSKVYTHGWVLALWIGSYMVVPIFTMGLLAKRLNQVARKTGAITIPDVFRDRFTSPRLGTLATLLIVFFMAINLVAQFKGGSIILHTLLRDVPLFQTAVDHLASWTQGVAFLRQADPGYLACLFVFAAVVVVYTTYGGFRAVVWTDVMQGLFMVAGVLVMLPLALWQVGGLSKATEQMAKMTPPLPVKIELSLEEPASERIILPRGSWLITPGSKETGRQAFRTNVRAQFAQGAKVATLVISDGVDSSKLSALRITTPEEVQNAKATPFPVNIRVKVLSEGAYASGKDRPGVYVTGPGPSENKIGGFLPLSLAISFFFMWTFSGSGQPGNMIRLMAFRDTKTLRRSIFAVAIYYTLIYFPLVIIFCCSRVLLPGWESESDRIMPEMARVLTIGIGLPALAGLLVAAPFAAVMSTMDSFLLLVSSALVRDIYQRDINPDASEQTIKRLTYIATIGVGTIAMVGAINPPVYLQDIIVYTSSGLAASFLAPMAMGLYWQRVNSRGAIAGMVCGFLAHLSLYIGGYIYYGRFQPVLLFDLDPIMPGMAISLLVVIIVSLCTSPPPKDQVRRYFYISSSKRVEKTATDASAG